MISKEDAVKSLLEMFNSKDFPKQLAFTVINRRSDDKPKPSDRWSIGNQLIQLFIGQTSDARTYHQWQEVSRFVKKGSSAFPIFAPITKKVKDETDPDKDKVLLLGFKLLPVFKIEDTDGEPLPEYDYTPPKLPPFLEVAEKLGIQVKWKPINRGAYGYYSLLDKSITLGSQDYFVYFHELAHAVNATFAELNKDIPRAEIVADLTAAVLCEMQQIDGYQAQTYDYIRHYCQDKDDKAVIKAIMGALNDVEKIITIIMDTAAQSSQVKQTA
jgi:antirestriction protein ArdC